MYNAILRHRIIYQTIIIISNHHCVVQVGDATGVGGEERRSSPIQQVSNHCMDCRRVVVQVGDVAAAGVGGGAAAAAGGGERPGPAAAPHVPPLLQLERAAGAADLVFVMLCDSRKCCFWFCLYIYIYIYI